ncbi:MAG: UDP-N-acetylmuramoyl-L-alanine--D-glutamate ligase [Treponema sp.]|jgi:UDP-N-acetylmuramoylalanine--D-glutamate ligase|nr:UDP-N-acetylmuramoyl-L-alanine--D-glutamate ligase [Treponema sp.]
MQIDYRGMKILVMGLGLNGGGLESALYLARRGAELRVTDLRDEKVLGPSLEKLQAAGGNFRLVLGRHDMEDFRWADMVIKNPGVRPDSPYLQVCRRIETDISLFLMGNPARLLAVTGSKGKSGTASALHWVLAQAREGGRLPGKAYLGGNITVSPLSFLDDLSADDNVVLELSSWQLGDLRGRGLLKPRTAVLTAIMPDHLDRYGSMEEYVADKRLIYHDQGPGDLTVVPAGDWGDRFLKESPARVLAYGDRDRLPADGAGAWLEGERGQERGLARLVPGGPVLEAVPEALLTPGAHQKHNFLAAALALLDLGLQADFVREGLGSFPGIEDRLEFFREAAGVRYYNDSAATIPEAAAAAVEAFEGPLVLVAGGADKNLDFGPLAETLAGAQGAGRLRGLVLLAGAGSDRLIPLLDRAGVPFMGPAASAEEAALLAIEVARPGDRVVLSPGCTSFGMFQNEFDRGRKWKEAVLGLSYGH